MDSSETGNPGIRRYSDRLLLNSRLAVVAGFGGLIAVMAVAGIDSLHGLGQMRRENDEIRRQFLFRNHVLNEVRSDLYLSGTYLRDYLLEPDPSRATAFRGNLEEVRRHMDSALASYASRVEPDETKPYTALTTELNQYWQTLAPSLSWNAKQRRDGGYLFLRDQVFPRRTAMLEIAERIADINEQQLDEANDRAGALLLKFQNRLAFTFWSTLLLGLAMAGVSTRRILALEAKARIQYQEVSEARIQLTNLSDRLVQAQEAERRALSRELHDEVGQSLSAVLVELRNLSAVRATRSDEEWRSQIELIKGLVENTTRVVRNMALLLRPSMLDDLGLVPALRWQAREVSKQSSMDVSVVTQLEADGMPDEYKTCIYRVVQEALHNCLRHSQASYVRIRVEEKPGALALSIEDDGKGFEVKHSKGLGLLGMEERVTRLGGTFEVQSVPGSGTILFLELPFDRSSSTQHVTYERNPHPAG